MRSLILILAALAVTLPAHSQTTFATITGTVTDSSGLPAPGVKISVRNEGTNIVQQTVTDARGDYEVTHLNPDSYEVIAVSQGFKKFVKTNILLAAASTVRIDVPLQVGDVTTEVTVVGGAALVESESSNLSGVRSNLIIERMPINSRGSFNGFFYDMLQLTPGAMQVTGQSYFSLGGTRGGQNQFTVDGTSVNSPQNGNAVGVAQLSMEATSELKIDLANNKAEYNLPGMVSGISKSGANALHGSLFYYHQNGAFNARNAFQNTVPFLISHDAGGSISGPVYIPKFYSGRNRTFFFYDYETFPAHGQLVATPNVPTEKMRAGDFSAAGVVVKDPFTGLPFPGNIIPSSRLSSVSLKAQEFYPHPNFGTADSFVGNWRSTITDKPSFKHQQDVRIDHVLSRANSLFGRFSYAAMANLAVPGVPLPALAKGHYQDRRVAMLTLADTHLINPNLINEFRYGLLWTHNSFGMGLKGADVVQSLGLQGLSTGFPDISGIPVMNITGFTSISDPNPYGFGEEGTHNFIDNLTWTHHAHTIKAGGEFRHNFARQYPSTPSGAFGTFSFNNVFSGFAYADFLLGLPQTSSRLNPAPIATLVNTDSSFFFQDDWKVSRKLTLNLGFRYDLNPPYHEVDGRFFQFDVATGRVIVPGAAGLKAVNPLFPSNLIPVVTAQQASYPSSLFNTDKLKPAPRFGFAYRPFATATFVVRGGYGIYNNPLVGFVYGSTLAGPFVSNENFTNSIVNGVPLYRFPQGFPAGFGTIGVQSFTPNDPNLKRPVIQQWNMTVERELLHMGLRASYVATVSRKLVWIDNVNQPTPGVTPFTNNLRKYPAIGDVLYRVNGGNSNYQSLNFVAERKDYKGLYYQFGWTWAKEITDILADGQDGYRPENPASLKSERSNTSYVPRHRVVAQLLYTLPVGPGRTFLSSGNGASSAIFGGWTISSNLTRQTGQWFTPTFTGYDVSNTNLVGGRPDRIANGNLPSSQRTIYRWFDASAFVVPGDLNGDGKPDVQVGRFGNSAPTVLLGPGLFNLNAGLHKGFRIRERANLLIQFTATNALNHVNYNLPAANISSPATVGRITSAGPARTGMLGARIEF